MNRNPLSPRLAAFASLALLAPAVGGCVINSDKYARPRDLAPAWLVDRPRVLAVRADPPEIAPGETAALSALLPTPNGESLTRAWFACPPSDPSGSGFGCTIDPAVLAGTGTTTGTGTALDDLGFIGLEPGFPPFYTAATDALDGLDDAARLEGLYVLVQVFALPPEYLDPEAAPEDIDYDAVEAAYKRLIVSDATTPNHNPELTAFTVDGVPVPAGAVAHVDGNQSYELGVILADDAIEDYVYVTSEGVTEDRTEEPYLSWYATGGDLLESVTLVPYVEATWTSPKPGEEGTWYTVLRDRRGGMSWLEQPWVAD